MAREGGTLLWGQRPQMAARLELKERVHQRQSWIVWFAEAWLEMNLSLHLSSGVLSPPRLSNSVSSPLTMR